MGKTKAIEHKLFLGSLDRDKLGFGEKLITRIVRAPEGDFRQWDHIRAWAQELADKLEAATPNNKQATAAN
jgi:menaquinone-dependent protoporphyrinogen oxidase